jgi:CubicO group peptidase (beta-lactamase class C family)
LKGIAMRFINLSRAISTFGITFLFCVAALGAEIPDPVKKAVQDRVDGGKTMGMVIGVVDADGATYFGYGKMAASGDETPGKDSVFEIGSISKVFTGILLADAVNRGEVKYDDTIETHLPKGVKAPTKDGNSITLEHLSVQNSGLPRMPDNFSPADPTNPYADYTVDQLYEFLGNVKLARGVGEEYEYSNVGVGLLGHMLELATEQSYEELVVSRISEVLGMPDTTITLSDDMGARLAIGHQGEQEVANWDLPTFAGAGALRSTAQDMIVFLEANMGLRESPLLEAMKETHRSRARAGGIVMDIGLGWHIRKMAKGQNVIWHNGGTGGYRTFAGFVHDPPMGVVVLTNSTGAGDDDIGLHMLNEALPMAAFTPRDIVKVADSILERYVGKYELAPGVRFDVRLRDNQLLVQLTGQPRFPVFPESETNFFLKVVDAQITFNVDDDGNVTSLTLHQNGQNQEAKKMD